MFRSFALLALLFISCAARAEEAMPAEVGGTTVQLPIPAGYVRASQAKPAFYGMVNSSLPPEIRMIETMLAPADLGSGLQHPYFVYAVIREAEPMNFTRAQWDEGRPLLVEGLTGTDPKDVASDMVEKAGEQMSEAAGTEVNLQMGEISRIHVYSQAEDAIRFTQKIPMKIEVGGQKVEKVLDYAAAMMVLNGKLVMICVYTKAEPEDTQFARARALLEDMVQRADALNDGAVG